MIARSSDRFFVVLGVVLFVGLAVFGSMRYIQQLRDENWSRAAVQQSQEIGNRIITQIERFRADTGRYPDSLRQLVPTYADSIPQPTAGNLEWKYEKRTQDDGDTGFVLKFWSNRDGFPEAFYEHGRGWYVDR